MGVKFGDVISTLLVPLLEPYTYGLRCTDGAWNHCELVGRVLQPTMGAVLFVAV